MPRALMLVASNATDPDRVDAFHEWYEEHVQELLRLEGIVRATRWEASAHQLLPGVDSIGDSLPRINVRCVGRG